jgi:uncharacterized membrane protein
MREDNEQSPTKLPDSVNENLCTIADYCARHEEEVSWAQSFIEKLSVFLGSPGYVAGNVVFIVCWIILNLAAPALDFEQFDEPPFFWLQGFVSLNAFIISTTVLIRQNRMSKLAEHNAHLDLQISLLAEEKTSKIIAMLDAIRRDSPILPDKDDAEAEELSHSADTSSVLEAIERDDEQNRAHKS